MRLYFGCLCALLFSAIPFFGRNGLAQQSSVPSFQWPTLNGKVPQVTRLELLSPPLFVIGSASNNDSTLFDGIAGAVRLPNRVLAIGDAGNNRILYFDQSGRFLRAIGRVGDGPGEFRQPRWFGKCANGTLILHDGSNARLTYLSSDGRVIATATLPVGLNFDQVFWCNGGQRLLVLLNQPRDRVPRGEYLDVPTALILVNEKRLDTIVSAVPQEFYTGRDLPALAPVPLGTKPLATATAHLAFLCTNSTGRCQIFDTSGVRLAEFTLDLAKHPVREADWSHVLADYSMGEPSRAGRKILASLLREIRPRDTFPLLDQIKADPAGNLWIRTYDNFPDPIATWLVVSQRGTPVALAATKRSLYVLEIGNDYLVGLTRDDDGVERIELYAFRPLGPAPAPAH
jgi:hypothetical protein